MKLARSIVLVVVALAGAAHAQTAAEILKMVDVARRNFTDLQMESKMTIYEPGATTGREARFTTQVKGDKRLVRFTAPADVRGMGILTEGRDTMYALLPAFGNRIRRMGTHMRNQSFMGSDIPNEEIAGGDMADSLKPTLVGTDGNAWILELVPLPGKESAFPKQKMWVDKTFKQAVRIEYSDDQGKALTIVYGGWEKDGNIDHYSPHNITYTDHRRRDHKTTVEMTNVRINSGIPDDVFTQRGLQRTN